MKTAIIAAVYVAFGFLTYGTLVNERWCGSITTRYVYLDGGGATVTEHRGCAKPFFGGVFWPVYWIGEAAIWVTK